MSDPAAGFQWGIWGTGDVARKFGLGLRHVEGASLAWVLSRDATRAKRFGKRLGAGAFHGDPEEALRAGADAVYIATPTAHHADHAVAALEAGLHVLVEKPLAANEAEARRIAEAAARTGKFAMEAMWTRFQPALLKARALIEEGAIGTPRQLRGELCIASSGGSLFDPAGGGALRQRGIYPLSLASYLLGLPEEGRAMLRRGETGIDEDITAHLRHPGGALTQLRASVTVNAPNTFEVLGDRGALRFDGRIWRPSALRLSKYSPRPEGRGGGRLANFQESPMGQRLQNLLMPLKDKRGAKKIAAPYAGNGYGHQAEHAMAQIAAGATESPIMPLSESIALAALMDRLLAEGEAS